MFNFDIQRHFTTIIDGPTGSGKTHRMLISLTPDKQWLLVTPRLTECWRFCDCDEETGQELPQDQKLHPDVEVVQPDRAKGVRNKTEHLIELLRAGKNVAITHALYDNLKDAADAHLLANVHVIIDEVVDPIDVRRGVSADTLNKQLIGHDYASVDPVTQQLRPTEKWDGLVETRRNRKTGEQELVNGFHPDLYMLASRGKLLKHSDSLFLVATPPEVLLGGKSLTIMTFRSEGSYLLRYLQGLSQAFPKAQPHVVKIHCAEFIRKATELVTAEFMDVSGCGSLGYEGQEKMTKAQQAKMGIAIRNYRQRKWGSKVPANKTAVVCAKSKWEFDGYTAQGDKKKFPTAMSKETRLFKEGTFISAKTRAVNKYDHLTHMFFCYDIHANPTVMDFLGCRSRQFDDDFALAECIQTVWRLAQRRHKNPEPVTVAFASKRMFDLFTAWQRSLIEVEGQKSDEFKVLEAA